MSMSDAMTPAFGRPRRLWWGVALASWSLAAQAAGLATIPQAALAGHADVVRKHLGVGDDRRVVCGISFGYPDAAHLANSYRTNRASIP